MTARKGESSEHMHKDEVKFVFIRKPDSRPNGQTLIKLLCLLKEHKKRLPTFAGASFIINAHKRRCVATNPKGATTRGAARLK